MIETIMSKANKMFRDEVRRFAAKEIKPYVKDWEKQGKYPDDYYQKLSDMGFMGLLVPEEYGGSGGSLMDLVILCEEMGKV
ncbi:MAG: acyl-CoA dehydrogenase family protein, partial [Pseudomonadota bacterium]